MGGEGLRDQKRIKRNYIIIISGRNYGQLWQFVSKKKEYSFTNKKGTTIMKKTYMKPSTLTTKVGVHLMLVGSPDVTINKNSSVNAANVDSRRSNDLWDDEEED
jgi:hypothetical protein